MNNEIEEKLISTFGGDLQRNVPLSSYSSIGVGGPANYFYVANNIDSLVKAVTTSFELNIPYIILGGGYNIVPSDLGYEGLVVKNECGNIAFSGDTSEVIIDSGVPLGKLINLAASRDLGGLEFLYGIPGTVGGAVYGNAGAFNYEIGDFVKSVIMLTPKMGKMTIVKKDNSWFNFSYRNSKLKNEFIGDNFRPIILTVKLQLVRRRRDEIIGFMQQNLIKKQQSQPLSEKSAGSFFKNPAGGAEGSAGFLLDQAGSKKIKFGGAAFSKKHANFLINKKNATANDIKSLAEKAKSLVKDKFNKNLEEEIENGGHIIPFLLFFSVLVTKKGTNSFTSLSRLLNLRKISPFETKS